MHERELLYSPLMVDLKGYFLRRLSCPSLIESLRRERGNAIWRPNLVMKASREPARFLRARSSLIALYLCESRPKRLASYLEDRRSISDTRTM